MPKLISTCIGCPVFEQKITAAVIYAKWEANDSLSNPASLNTLSGGTETPSRLKIFRGWLGKLIDRHNEYVNSGNKSSDFDVVEARQRAINERLTDESFCQAVTPVESQDVDCRIDQLQS